MLMVIKKVEGSISRIQYFLNFKQQMCLIKKYSYLSFSLFQLYIILLLIRKSNFSTEENGASCPTNTISEGSDNLEISNRNYMVKSCQVEASKIFCVESQKQKYGWRWRSQYYMFRRRSF
jgi:hypothetical protein